MSQPAKSVHIGDTHYFKDGVRRIDYVLFYDRRRPCPDRDKFLANLDRNYFDLESVPSIEHPDYEFVKVHATYTALKRFLSTYNIPVKHVLKFYIPEPLPKFKFMYTPITNITSDAPLYRRSGNLLINGNPLDFTTAERSFIVFHAMKHLQFSMEGHDNVKYGILQLMHHKKILDAYPLHDGTCQWSNNEQDEITSRQLLAKYWANYAMWNKAQPLNLIEQYFGNEFGLYFAWLGFYTRMLTIASILGFIMFIYGILSITLFQNTPLQEVCNSYKIMCPSCKECPPYYLKDICNKYRLASISDNPCTLLFAVAITIWATVFIELWKRRQATLGLRWNLKAEFEETDVRPAFEAKAVYTRLTSLGEPEQYIKNAQKIWRYSLIILFIVILISIMMSILMALTIYKLTMVKMLNKMKKSTLYATSSTAILTTITMSIFRATYKFISKELTNLELLKTQSEFDKSFSIKLYAYSFINCYIPIFYLAFVKGKLYPHPKHLYEADVLIVKHDLCDPAGCTIEVFLFLFIIAITRPLFDSTLDLVIQLVTIWLKKKNFRVRRYENMPRWEQDYHLNSTFRIIAEYEKMMTQFGFITMFAVAFPIAPMFALASNIVEIRVAAHKITFNNRRCFAKRVSHIGAWCDIVQFLVYFSIMTNSFYIAFTSEFITKLAYQLKYDYDLVGYIDFTLSEYKPDDLFWNGRKVSSCWYTGFRYPTGHRREYEHTTDYYYVLMVKLAFVVIFEHLMLVISGVLAYAIPDIPRSVKEKMAYEAKILRKNAVY